jgi:hypothetical protein
MDKSHPKSPKLCEYGIAQCNKFRQATPKSGAPAKDVQAVEK